MQTKLKQSTMAYLENATTIEPKVGDYSYLSGMKDKKEINWLFPNGDTEISIEDYEKKIFKDEHSGDMSLKKFKEELEEWLATLN